MSHLENKCARARAMMPRILEMAEEFGQRMPAHYPGCPDHIIMIDRPPLRITITPNRFRAYMAKSKNVVGEHMIERDGWKVVDICWYNERRACFNVFEDEIELYQFQPGRWELALGVDPEGDFVPVLPRLFADDKDPAWRAFKQSSFAKFPPETPAPGA
jgi:hypothetical protein